MVDGWRRRTHAAFVVTAVLAFVWTGSAQEHELGAAVGFVVQVDLDGSGVDEVVIGVTARASATIPEFSAPGDVFVFARDPSDLPSSELVRAFSCRDSLPEDLLPAFFHPALVAVGDLDGNSHPEVLLVWTERFWWPTAYRPLAVLHFDQRTRTYEMVVDTDRYVCGLGAYIAEDVLGDGRLEILEIKPVYSQVTDSDDGTEEWKCRYCPQYYGVTVISSPGQGFSPDPRFNDGKTMITTEKYAPGFGKSPVSEFLDELILLVRSYAE